MFARWTHFIRTATIDAGSPPTPAQNLSSRPAFARGGTVTVTRSPCGRSTTMDSPPVMREGNFTQKIPLGFAFVRPCSSTSRTLTRAVALNLAGTAGCVLPRGVGTTCGSSFGSGSAN